MPVGDHLRNSYMWRKSDTFKTITLFDIFNSNKGIAKVFVSTDDKKIYIEKDLKKYGPFENTNDAKNAIFGLVLE